MRNRVETMYALFSDVLDTWSLIAVDDYRHLIGRAHRDLGDAISRHDATAERLGIRRRQRK